MTEHDEQATLFTWADTLIAQGRIPQLSNMFSIPNGAWTKNYTVARKLIEEGLRKGVLDIFLAYPNNTNAGLFIEMKYGKNKLSIDQLLWKDRLLAAGYECVACWSWIDAARKIVVYLGYQISDFPELIK
jgi:hypothetical protein